jgi:hypothetical protein
LYFIFTERQELDLKDASLVDRDVMGFLARWEADGVKLRARALTGLSGWYIPN